MYFISIPKDPALENVMVYLYIVSVLTEIPYSLSMFKLLGSLNV